MIIDIFHKATANISGVWLDIYAFERSNHAHIPKSNISHAIAVPVWRDAADSHAYSQDNCAILDKEVPGAVGCSLRFGHNNIIVILNGQVVESEPCSWGVDAVSVEGEHDEWPFKREAFDQIDLSCCIDANIEIVEKAVVAVVQFNVELGWVFEHKIVHGGEVAVDIPQQMGAGVLVGQVFFAGEEAEHPPVVASAVDFPAAVDGDVGGVVEGDEILVVFGSIWLSRPVPHILRSN